jgi:cytochrome P450
MLAGAERAGALGWDEFVTSWFAMVRRVVLGDGARDDHELTDLLARLRADANWAFARPKRTGLRERFDARLRHHLERAEPGSLAEMVASVPVTEATSPHQQVPQWLFAFDATAWATYRALALVAAHRDHAARVADEVAGRDLTTPQDLPLLRATVLESLRLWPTTPAVLRDTTTETTWPTGTLPAGTGVVIYAPLFHRDDSHLPSAHRLDVGHWSDGRSRDAWPLIPFSGGPGECPGRNLVLLVASTVLANLVAGHEPRLLPPTRLDATTPLPGTLDPFSLKFGLERRAG